MVLYVTIQCFIYIHFNYMFTMVFYVFLCRLDYCSWWVLYNLNGCRVP